MEEGDIENPKRSKRDKDRHRERDRGRDNNDSNDNNENSPLDLDHEHDDREEGVTKPKKKKDKDREGGKKKKKKKERSVAVDIEHHHHHHNNNESSSDIEYTPPLPRLSQSLVVSAIFMLVVSISLLGSFLGAVPFEEVWSVIACSIWLFVTAIAAIVAAASRTVRTARFYRTLLWCYLPLSISSGSLNLILLLLSPCTSPCKLVADCANPSDAQFSCRHQLFLSFALFGATLFLPPFVLCLGFHATANENLKYVEATSSPHTHQSHHHRHHHHHQQQHHHHHDTEEFEGMGVGEIGDTDSASGREALLPNKFSS